MKQKTVSTVKIVTSAYLGHPENCVLFVCVKESESATAYAAVNTLLVQLGVTAKTRKCVCGRKRIGRGGVRSLIVGGMAQTQQPTLRLPN
jgi:hypothetical protein